MIAMALARRKPLALALVLVLVALAVAWRALGVSDLTRIGVGYAAARTCACVFVSGRPLESCRGDLDPLARKIVRLRVGAAEVTASSLSGAHATARYQRELGCSLED